MNKLEKRKDRTGTGTCQFLACRLVTTYKKGFPVVTTKKVNFKVAV